MVQLCSPWLFIRTGVHDLIYETYSIQNKATQQHHLRPAHFFLLREEELPQVGFEPTHLCSLDKGSTTKLPR